MKITVSGEDFTFKCINREQGVQAPPAREDFLAAATFFFPITQR